jgi:SAM-dependent methyltransferase
MLATTNWKWHALSLVMRTVGRTSTGIDLGYRQGFDSGPMLDYVYRNRPSGRWGIGALADWLYLNTIGWRAIRARKTLLKRVLRAEIAGRARPGAPVVLADVAAGPGRYLLELSQEPRPDGTPLAAQVQVICRDLDRAGLAQGAAQAAALGLTNLRYEPGDATDAASLAQIRPTPAIVVVSGLYELFTDAAPIQRSLRGIYALLPPGGTLVFTTQVRHPQLELIANVLVNREGRPWVMVCRGLAEVEGWARAAGFTVAQSQEEPLGLFGVTVCRKPLS